MKMHVVYLVLPNVNMFTDGVLCEWASEERWEGQGLGRQVFTDL